MVQNPFNPFTNLEFAPAHIDTEKIYDLTKRQQWYYNFLLPNGIQTNPEYEASQWLKSKTHTVNSLDLTGKRVLDVGCSEGWYSFLAAQAGATYVLGIDIDQERIDKADLMKNLYQAKSVDFRVMNLYDQAFEELEQFDYAFCFGLLHRLPDPISFIGQLATKTSAVLFEWQTKSGFADQNLSRAVHQPGGVIEWHNAKTDHISKEQADSSNRGLTEKRAPYWLMSYGCVEAVCQRTGLAYFKRIPMLPPSSNSTPGRLLLIASRTELDH